MQYFGMTCLLELLDVCLIKSCGFCCKISTAAACHGPCLVDKQAAFSDHFVSLTLGAKP